MVQREVIRVLHVIGIMDRGGAESMIMNLYREIDRERFQFDFVVHASKKGAYDNEIYKLGGTIYHCPQFTMKNIAKYKKWWNDFFASKGDQYQIVHGHIGSTAPIYLKCARENGVYTIAHSHNTTKICNIKSILYRILSRRVCGIAHHYLACGEKAGKNRFGANQKFQVLNNAIPSKQYIYSEPKRKQIQREYNLENYLVLGHVGRFVEAKNHNYLIDVFNEVIQKTPAKLLLVGDGPLRLEIERKVHRLGLQDHVIFTGVREDVADLMQAMDVFVFPSLYEGLPLSVVEAQAAGLPCLISDGVPIECKLTDLVQQISLSSDVEVWTESVIKAAKGIRRNTYQEICTAGFDIESNTKKLERYYKKIVAGETDICL